jgi:hypothetical protein
VFHSRSSVDVGFGGLDCRRHVGDDTTEGGDFEVIVAAVITEGIAAANGR